MVRSSRSVVLVAAAAAAASCAPEPAGRDQPRESGGRPVLVTVVIDQFPAWLADERLPELPEGGGFARLRREGLYVRDMRYAHAIMHTGPGHAALYTGLPPRESGITIDTVFDPRGEEVSAYLGGGARLVTPDGGGRPAPGSSGARLRGEGIADRLRRADRRAFIASVSLKDRGAIFAAGRAPDVCLWFDPATGGFATSTAYGARFPAWARPLGDRRAVAATWRRPWRPLDREWLLARASTPDDQPGESNMAGLGTVFPHRPAGSRAPKAFRATPAADAAVLALATAAVDRVPADAPVLIAVSLSANDYIGHAYGPESWESWDEWRRLDAALSRFMAHLDEVFGPGGWSMMLTGDHGVAPLPETLGLAEPRPWCRADTPDRWGRACAAGHRLLRWPLTRRLEEVAAATLAKAGPWVAGVIEPQVLLTDAARALSPERRRLLIGALRAEIERDPAVARTYDVAEMPAACPPRADQSIDALVCRSVVPGGAGDIYVLTRPGSFFDPDDDPGHGANHGTPYLYDRAVPLFVRAPGRVPAGAVIDRPVAFTTFARTAATLLGVSLPAAVVGGVDLTRPP